MPPTPSTRQYSPDPILLKYCKSPNVLKWPYLGRILSELNDSKCVGFPARSRSARKTVFHKLDRSTPHYHSPILSWLKQLGSGKIELYSYPFFGSIDRKVVKTRFHHVVKWVRVVTLKGIPILPQRFAVLPHQTSAHQSKRP